MAGDQAPFALEMGSSKVDPKHALKLRNFVAAEEVMSGDAQSRPLKGLSKTKKEAEEAAAFSEAMKKKAEEAAAVAEAMKKAEEEAMKKADEAAAVADAMKKKAVDAAAVAEAMKKAGEEAEKKMEEVAAVVEAVKPTDLVDPTAFSSYGETAADSSDEEDIPTVKVHHQDTVDYILSWTYAEKNPFENPFEDDDDDDGFITAEDREAFAYLAASTEVLISYQKKVRDEYNATGYVRVADDYEEGVARLQAASDAAYLLE